MTRKKLRSFKPGTADYVIAHAKWRASRGHQPSMSYMGEKNPIKALLLAKTCQGLNIIEDKTPFVPECKRPRVGLRVVVTELQSAAGMVVADEYLNFNNRKAGIVGKLHSCVAGHGGDVWLVEHEGDAQRIGAFAINEFKRHSVQIPWWKKPLAKVV